MWDTMMNHLMGSINKKLALVRMKVIYTYMLQLTQLTKELLPQYQILLLLILTNLIEEKKFVG